MAPRARARTSRATPESRWSRAVRTVAGPIGRLRSRFCHGRGHLTPQPPLPFDPAQGVLSRRGEPEDGSRRSGFVAFEGAAALGAELAAWDGTSGAHRVHVGVEVLGAGPAFEED